jgi:hypothetical protein
MTRLMIATLLLAGAAPAFAADKSFPVGAFTQVSASGSEDITITTGKAVSVVATGPQDKLDKLDIRVEGDTLKIGHKKGNWGWNWSSGDEVTIRVSVPQLHGVRVAGSGNVTADSGSGPAFVASSSGSGDIKVARLNSPSVSISTAGSGDVTAAGQCTTAKISVSGSSNINAGALKCVDADIGISGSGDVKLAATGNANVRISGSGDVVVTGGARCQSKVSGSGDVTCG